MKENRDYSVVYNNAHMDNYAYLADAVDNMSETEKKAHIKGGKFIIGQNKSLFLIDQRKLAINDRTHQFLMYLAERFTVNVPPKADDAVVNSNLSVIVPFVDIARDFGITTKAAKALALDACLSLQLTVIQGFWEDSNKEYVESVNILWKSRLETDKKTRQGKIVATFSPDFAKKMTYMAVTQYPKNLRLIPVRYYTSANKFGSYLSHMYNVNYGTSRHRYERVSTILSKSYAIPSKAILEKGARQYYKRIISPFIRNMDALVEYNVLSVWKLIYNDKVLPREEYATIGYDKFIKCDVFYDIDNYPDEQRIKSLLSHGSKISKLILPERVLKTNFYKKMLEQEKNDKKILVGQYVGVAGSN